ncbi:hypothetical protein [Amycolatopsis sp. BJA-103]|uniref:hypothetical protein n=1 Tax=Amycolatopsis sp. BJA-103 TaxID=1911175 RepID=UPI000C7699C1|nr:hypothetical protein [Amycolatopsis sp. BJA-103]AUI64445.1 hypothetical protein BKN51_15730 [Amycolatopsis sp. BJA-103]PNE17816.1 hypothetical protein B1H26_18800 [Amycolatopsis sp. BJA-103]
MIGAEAQYRTLVRVLPVWYRAERGDEMVGTLLDLHGERARAALWSELWALLALGVRTRLAGRAAPARTVALGDLTRVGVLLGLLWGVLRSAGYAGDRFWLVLAHPGGDLSPFMHSALRSDLIRHLVLLAAALVPLALLVDGWRRAARIAAVAILAAGALWGLTRYSLSLGPDLVVNYAPQWLPLVLLLLAFHADAPLPPARPWWWAIGGSLVAAVTAGYLFADDLSGLAGLSPLVWLCALSGAGYLLLRRRIDQRAAAWTLALAVCLALVVAQTLVLKRGIITFDLLTIAQVSLAGLVVAALTVTGIRDYRRTVVNR